MDTSPFSAIIAEIKCISHIPSAHAVVEPVDNECELRKRVDDSIIAGRFAEAADYISQLTEYLERNNKDTNTV